MAFSSDQLAHLERRLHEERELLTSQLNSFTEPEAEDSTQDQAGNLSRQPFHQADLATDTQTEELEASIATRRSGEIAEIDAALARLITTPESFGLDEETGEQIPFERLDIIPWARTKAH
jgi:DnaK suppressor protein